MSASAPLQHVNDPVAGDSQGRESRNYDKKAMTGQDPAQSLFNPAAAVGSGREGFQETYRNYQTAGQYVTGHPDDDLWQMWASIPGGTDSQLGQKFMPPEFLQYVREKRDKISGLQEMELASMMIDPSDSTTIERAQKIYPKLKYIPEKLVERDLGIQLAIYRLLQRGSLGGPQDVTFVNWLIREDVWLPVSPLWDTQGYIAGLASGNTQGGGAGRGLVDRQEANNVGVQGFFKPYRFFPTSQDNPNNNLRDRLDNVQVMAKAFILKACFAAFRYTPIGQVGDLPGPNTVVGALKSFWNRTRFAGGVDPLSNNSLTKALASGASGATNVLGIGPITNFSNAT